MTTEKKLTYVDLLADETIHDAYERAADRIGSELGRSHPMYINGAETWAHAAFTVTSPFDTEILVGRFQQGGGDHVRAAIAAARAGLEDWSAKAWRERTAIIRETADRLDDQKFLLSALVTYECGKNRYEALAEVSEAVDLIRYYADVYEKNEGYIVPMSPESPGAECRRVMRPHGVWAVISPFNFPLALAAGMAGAALVTGNTVVLKPTSTAPGSALKLYEACRAGGVPRGAIQFITGPGSMFGETNCLPPGYRWYRVHRVTGCRDVAGAELHHTATVSKTGDIRDGKQEPGHRDRPCGPRESGGWGGEGCIRVQWPEMQCNLPGICPGTGLQRIPGPAHRTDPGTGHR
jgi:1-pyrroline-5-carboxylate dehydrogenase